LPFLEDFLSDAESFWRERRAGIARSGLFTVEHAEEQILLRASAMLVSGRPLLLIERLVGTADPRDILQKAREKGIEHERLAESLAKLHGPLEALVRAANALVATELSAAQRSLVDDVVRSAARAQALLGPPLKLR
jgi:hypothetical protein